MASLVADYGSEDDSGQDSDQTQDADAVQPGETVPAGKNYLISDENDKSDSDDCKTNSSTEEKLPNPMLGKLPHPQLKKKKKTEKVAKVTAASVFTNPFEKAEMAKQSVLEKHVKMTEGQNISGKVKVCKKFKQGKCRFEKNCKYSHNLDSNLMLRYMQDEAKSDVQDNNETIRKNYPQLPPPPKPKGFMGTMDTMNTVPRPSYTPQQKRNFREQERQMQVRDEDLDDRGIMDNNRKKRVGVSQSLIPPKKAMSSLTKQRMEERPWTVFKRK